MELKEVNGRCELVEIGNNKWNKFYEIEFQKPEGWIDMVADGDKATAQTIQEELVHTLGNLTLSGYNSKLSNLSFEKKRDRKNMDEVYVGYKNGMFLNEDLKDKTSCKKEDIEHRGKKMIDLILKYVR